MNDKSKRVLERLCDEFGWALKASIHGAGLFCGPTQIAYYGGDTGADDLADQFMAAPEPPSELDMVGGLRDEDRTDHEHAYPVSQLERDLGLIGRWLMTGSDERTVTLSRRSASPRCGVCIDSANWIEDINTDRPTVEWALHTAATALAKDVVAAKASGEEQATRAAAILGDWTEGDRDDEA